MRVIIAAAGTGGHINPGIAIANKIMEKEPESEVIFIGTNRGLENDLVPRAGYKLKQIEAYGFDRKISIDNAKRIYKTFKSIKECKKIIDEFNPDIVIGTGGYICVPAVMAAKKKKVPVVLHESNAFPGVAIKMMSKNADVVLLGFEDAKKRLPKAKRTVVTGTPTKLRKINLTDKEKEEIGNSIGFAEKKPLVLVFGGSQGAQSINQSLIDIISQNKVDNYQIMWAAGPNQYDVIKQKLSDLSIDIENISNVKIVPYIYNMQEIMNYSDLVICRSGAMTITEIALLNKPAIFIPFPFATENHQEYNAKVLANVNAAKIILDKDLNSEELNKMINEILSDKNLLKQMGQNAAKIAVDNVEERIYKEIKKIVCN